MPLSVPSMWPRLWTTLTISGNQSYHHSRSHVRTGFLGGLDSLLPNMLLKFAAMSAKNVLIKIFWVFMNFYLEMESQR